MTPFAKTKLLTEAQKHEFASGLEAALNLQSDGSCNCRHDYEFVHARRVLDQMGLDTKKVEEVLKFFEENDGHCDCEIIMNVICGEEE